MAIVKKGKHTMHVKTVQFLQKIHNLVPECRMMVIGSKDLVLHMMDGSRKSFLLDSLSYQPREVYYSSTLMAQHFYQAYPLSSISEDKSYSTSGKPATYFTATDGAGTFVTGRTHSTFSTESYVADTSSISIGIKRV